MATAKDAAEDTLPGRGAGSGGIATAGLVLGLALVACAAIASLALDEALARQRTLTVKGFAERPITSDLASWRAVVVVRAADLREGYARLETARARTAAFLAEIGLPAAAVSVAAVNVVPRFRQNTRGHATNEIELYELHQGFDVETGDTALVDRASKEVTTLLREGFEVRSHPPSYHYTKLDELKIELLGAAAVDARTRAERIAGESGSRTGGLVSASQGVFQITPVTSTEVSAAGMYDTRSIRKSVRAVLTARFALEEG